MRPMLFGIQARPAAFCHARRTLRRDNGTQEPPQLQTVPGTAYTCLVIAFDCEMPSTV
jgi:hypothetical protein